MNFPLYNEGEWRKPWFYSPIFTMDYISPDSKWFFWGLYDKIFFFLLFLLFLLFLFFFFFFFFSFFFSLSFFLLKCEYVCFWDSFYKSQDNSGGSERADGSERELSTSVTPLNGVILFNHAEYFLFREWSHRRFVNSLLNR